MFCLPAADCLATATSGVPWYARLAAGASRGLQAHPSNAFLRFGILWPPAAILQAANGWATHSKHFKDVGAFINLEVIHGFNVCDVKKRRGALVKLLACLTCAR